MGAARGSIIARRRCVSATVGAAAGVDIKLILPSAVRKGDMFGQNQILPNKHRYMISVDIFSL
jgi:hypothetical protein